MPGQVLGPACKTRPPQWKRWSSGRWAWIHMEDKAVYLNLQKASGTIAEEGEESKLDNYPSQIVTAKIGANGNSMVDCVRQWTLEEFPHPLISEINSISELRKLPEWNSWRVYHVGTSGDWGSLEAGNGFSYLTPSPRQMKKKQKIWKQRSHPLFPNSQSFPP